MHTRTYLADFGSIGLFHADMYVASIRVRGFQQGVDWFSPVLQWLPIHRICQCGRLHAIPQVRIALDGCPDSLFTLELSADVWKYVKMDKI